MLFLGVEEKVEEEDPYKSGGDVEGREWQVWAVGKKDSV